MAWRKVTISDFRKRIHCPAEDDVVYKLVTVKLHHKGVIERSQKLAAKLAQRRCIESMLAILFSQALPVISLPRNPQF